jgi:hypothetical protein
VQVNSQEMLYNSQEMLYGSGVGAILRGWGRDTDSSWLLYAQTKKDPDGKTIRIFFNSTGKGDSR